jgi:hypothetical protein
LILFDSVTNWRFSKTSNYPSPAPISHFPKAIGRDTDNCFKTAKVVGSAFGVCQEYHQWLMAPAQNNADEIMHQKKRTRNNSREIGRRNKQVKLSSNKIIS